MTLFQTGNFVLNSGFVSAWKIECDALTQDDWNGLATMAVELFGHPGSVEGVPRGGIPFEMALEPRGRKDGPLWIVDDVLTTGESMERQRAGRRAVGVVVFARGNCPRWIKPIFRMPPSAYRY